VILKKYRNRFFLLLIFIIILGSIALLLIKITQGPFRIARRVPPVDYYSLRDKWFKQIFLEKFLSNSIKEVNLEHCDLSELDLTDKFDILIYSSFDTKTQWPSELPEPFDPGPIMEAGKNPGLGIRGLHEMDITGKNVGVAMIDYALLTGHREYRKRLKFFEEIQAAHKQAHMHGTAMSSLAVGKRIGTAPGANLYFIAASNMKRQKKGTSRAKLDFSNTAKAVIRLLEINERLPEHKKIRVISISTSWAPGNDGYAEMDEAVNRAKEKGIFVISSNLFETYGYKFFFHGLDRNPLEDPDDFSAYSVIGWEEWISLLGKGRFPEFIRIYEEKFESSLKNDILLIPIYSRTVASPASKKEYSFSRGGGWSMVPPYLAGIYALACQVKPDITPEIFWAAALKTGEARIVQKGETKFQGKIINPVKLIQEIKSLTP
jgi:hypothetical protein